MENLSGGNLRERLMQRGTYYDEATAARLTRPNPNPTISTLTLTLTLTTGAPGAQECSLRQLGHLVSMLA